jgi:hypothetical protein
VIVVRADDDGAVAQHGIRPADHSDDVHVHPLPHGRDGIELGDAPEECQRFDRPARGIAAHDLDAPHRHRNALEEAAVPRRLHPRAPHFLRDEASGLRDPRRRGATPQHRVVRERVELPVHVGRIHRSGRIGWGAARAKRGTGRHTQHERENDEAIEHDVF